MKQILAWLLVALMLVTASVTAAARPVVETGMKLSVVPDMTQPFIMDPQNPHRPALTGYYNYDIAMKDGAKRTVKAYIPNETPPKRATVIIAAPDYADSSTFLEYSGWKALADEQLFTLVLAEPLDGVWAADEAEYITAVLTFVKSNTYYRHGGMAAYYLAGYGKGADVLAVEALKNTNQYAGAALLGGTGVSVSLLDEMRSTESAEPGVPQSEIPLPVWIAAAEETEQLNVLIDYWKEANKNGGRDITSNKFADSIYRPVAYLASTNEITEASVATVMVSWGERDYYAKDFVSYLWNDFLKRVQCYPAYGNNRVLRYWAEPLELGFEYVNLEVNEVKREMYVYIPSTVPADNKVPMVILFHGANVNGNEAAVRYGWYKVAEERGFILVCPSGYRTDGYITNYTWTIKNDMPFVARLIDHMIANYSVDSTRVYCSGSSNGSQMSLWCQAKIPEKIAATASYDMTMDISTYEPNEDYDIAVMAIVGDRDPLNNEGGLPILETKRYKAMSSYLINRFNLSEPLTYSNGNYDFYIHENETGVPLFTFELCNGRIHADMPEDAYVCYDFLCKFSREADGTLYYMGVPATK